MKLAGKITGFYVVLGLLTLLHWETVWLKGATDYLPWTRGKVTIVFSPLIVAAWPTYWATVLQLGTWAWVPSAISHSEEAKL